MIERDGEPTALKRLGHDVEGLGLTVLVAGSGMLGGLALLVVFLVVVLVASEAILPNTSSAGIFALTQGPTGFGTAMPPMERIAPEQTRGMPPVISTGGGLTPGWTERPALNQYVCANYRSTADCTTWAAAACSAAALDWLLGAYGVHVGGIDEAVRLIGPGTGISTAVGLLDSSGTRLSAAEAAVGLKPRRAQLRSSGDLRAWLSQGPLMLDGHAWFGVGHWFVAIAGDAGGIFTRDSSGNDTRYLSWVRLYGEVGWSGWAVGVQPAEGGPSA